MKSLSIGLMVFLCCMGSGPAKEVDRLLVAVNGTVITEGDLYIAAGIDALVSIDNSNGFLDRNAFLSRENEIDRLIDLELIRQELRNLHIDLNDDGSIDARVQDLRERYVADGELVRVLEKFGIDESELNEFVKLEFSILKFVDFRFRPFVRIRRDEIEDYYNDRLKPQLRDSGIEIPPLEEVSDRIEKILTEETINSDLEQWIGNARRNARIEYFDRENQDKPISDNVLESSSGQRRATP